MAELKTERELAIMAEAGRRLAHILHALVREAGPGVTTALLDTRARELILAGGDKPAFLRYRPAGAAAAYPATICASVNDGVVHGLPSSRPLAEGDLLKIDIGLKHRGFMSDMAVTVPVGKVSAEARRLVTVTEEALRRAIRAARPGNTTGDIGFAVQSYVEGEGFSVVRTLTGHGIGRQLHEEPHVYNVGRPGEGVELKPGMVLAIEPMTTAGDYPIRQLPDDSFVTKDGSLAAHFEHTVAITTTGARVLTK